MAYNPAAMTTTSAGLAHLASVYYKRRALDRLMKKFLFMDLCFPDELPLQSGRTAQWFRYNNLVAQTTPSTEGSVGTPLTISSRPISATISQFTNFITVSDLLEETALDPIVQNAAELLGYAAGLTTDTLTRRVFDEESSGANQAVQATYLRVSDLRQARHSLQANDVRPMEGGWFKCVAHPYATYDLVNDPSANGLADIMKYNTNVKDSALVRYEDRGKVVEVAGCSVMESTNVYTGSNPNTYRVYIAGDQGVGRLELAGKGPSKITDPRRERFRIRTVRNDGGNIADPEGVIGAAVAYNFKYVAVVVDGPAAIGGTYRFRTLDPQSSLG